MWGSTRNEQSLPAAVAAGNRHAYNDDVMNYYEIELKWYFFLQHRTVTCNMMHILHLLSTRLRVNRCKDSPCRCLALFKHNINPSGLWKSGSTNLASLSRWHTGPHEYGNTANKSLLHIVAKLIPHVCVRFLCDFFLHTFLPAVGLHASGAYWPVFRLWGEGGGHRWYMVIRSTHVRGIPSFF